MTQYYWSHKNYGVLLQASNGPSPVSSCCGMQGGGIVSAQYMQMKVMVRIASAQSPSRPHTPKQVAPHKVLHHGGGLSYHYYPWFCWMCSTCNDSFSLVYSIIALTLMVTSVSHMCHNLHTCECPMLQFALGCVQEYLSYYHLFL